MEYTPIIGFDFGNYNCFASYIGHRPDIQADGDRLGGMAIPLMQGAGIPSAFFYSEKRKDPSLPWCGEKTLSTQATPVKNRVRLLKRHLGESITLDDRTFSYDEMIVQVAQHCLRKAYADLKMKEPKAQTNRITLSYPATYTCAQRQRLIELMEQVTLENGEPVRVVGTIAEPAAAALDYLADQAKTDAETTVLTYDFGGGTFDLALVCAYPKGRKNKRGNTYYYDIINTRGIGDLGGADFDAVLLDLAKRKAKEARCNLNRMELMRLESNIESYKMELSAYPSIEFDVLTDDGGVEYIEIRRTEFENAVRPLVQRTIDQTRTLLTDYPDGKPEYILLTGGASRMPIIMEEMKKAFPEYADKIIYYRPEEAISFGAARFGTVEEEEDTGKVVVQQRTMYDLGDTCYDDDGSEMVEVFIPAGTELPCESEYHNFMTRGKTQKYVRFSVYEAKRADADCKNVNDDYTEIMRGELDLGRECPFHTRVSSRFVVDKLGCLTVEAFETEDPSVLLKKSVELKNLS